MGFWTDQSNEMRDPKRAFRFIVSIDGSSTGEDIPAYTVKKVTKPSFTLEESTHNYLNHTFYYPGRVTWNTVTLTIVDPVDPDAAQTLVNAISAAGYNPPTDATDLTTMNKAEARAALGSVKIQQIDADGMAVETWQLHNAWIKDVKFGDLAYDSDDLTEVEIEIRYDWASFQPGNTGDKVWGI